MERKERFHTHFMKLRHKLFVDWQEPEPLYVKTFFTPDRESDSEYVQNTTSWD